MTPRLLGTSILALPEIHLLLLLLNEVLLDGWARLLGSCAAHGSICSQTIAVRIKCMITRAHRTCDVAVDSAATAQQQSITADHSEAQPGL